MPKASEAYEKNKTGQGVGGRLAFGVFTNKEAWGRLEEMGLLAWVGGKSSG